jgi:hypothetical protein
MPAAFRTSEPASIDYRTTSTAEPGYRHSPGQHRSTDHYDTDGSVFVFGGLEACLPFPGAPGPPRTLAATVLSAAALPAAVLASWRKVLPPGRR